MNIEVKPLLLYIGISVFPVLSLVMPFPNPDTVAFVRLISDYCPVNLLLFFAIFITAFPQVVLAVVIIQEFIALS